MKKQAKHAKPSKSAKLAAKSLGAVALGAAFAAGGGGVAAADTGLPSTSDTLSAVDQTLPLGEVAEATLPAGAPEAVGSGVRAAGLGADALLDKATSDPGALLSSLPNVGELPVEGLPTDALLRG
ncbi:hypothetical protein G3I34_23300 [Streptomyces sp. SID8014]|uniref:hypothetical protein n=1 Tax=Streptomyces sp. SID8014 TaxID=2706097 RepID=UPI0013B5C32B|nr:hypothetical protein [Streptomyces sp. SID8014]NEC15139.1 hypothetical protein [Streptomyces sp. SID8014]